MPKRKEKILTEEFDNELKKKIDNGEEIFSNTVVENGNVIKMPTPDEMGNLDYTSAKLVRENDKNSPKPQVRGEDFRQELLAHMPQSSQPNIMSKLLVVYNHAKAKGLNPCYNREELIHEIGTFFDYVEQSGIKATKTALCAWLGICKDTYWQWEKGKRGNFSDIVGMANITIEMYLQNDLDVHTKGAMFLLKCGHGYKEATEVNINTNTQNVTSEEVGEMVQKLGLGLPKEDE